MEDVLSFAATIAREAGSLLKGAFATPHRITYKGDINIVTEADLLAENHLRERIRARFPDHDILAEESADAGTGAEYRWVVDPLDGTTNYAHGYPVFCVSVALECRRQIVLGVVHNPMLDECFSALRGGGAFLDGRALSVSRTDALTRSLLATGFPYDIRESRDNNLDHFETLALKAQAIRRAGSAALDLAYVAAGRFDGFWELKLAPWDTAAGWLLVEEAGGRVTDLDGGPYHLHAQHILASNGRIHPDLLELLSQT